MSDPDRRTMASGKRLVITGIIAAAHGMASYLLFHWTSTDDVGLIGIAFMIVQPAALSAFACYVADPNGVKSRRSYSLVPIYLVAGAIALGAIIFHEGVICCLMLAPIWLVSGLIGAHLVYRYRKHHADYSKVFSASFLALPLMVGAIEPSCSPAWQSYTVSRSAVIAAPATRIWPLLRGIPDVRPGEGRWNLTQDLFGVPRPLGAHLQGDGLGAVRTARWERGIEFSEVIDEWQAGRRIGWRFDFHGSKGWQFTDPHLRPDSSYSRIIQGGYKLDPIDATHARVTVSTTYAIRTTLNPYAAVWGQLFLGDLEGNLLTLIDQRAMGT